MIAPQIEIMAVGTPSDRLQCLQTGNPMATSQDPRSSESIAARDRRSIALALALLAFVVVVFAVTLVRLGGDVLNRPI
jgi:hypothetical protein